MEQSNTLADIIQGFLPELLKKRRLTANQLKTMDALSKCRTTQMGGSVMACNKCGMVHYVFHSCRNRHCPCCQGVDKELWIESRKHELLPVKYYHVVFTIPHILLEVFRFNKEQMYNLLFEKSWETLCLFASDPKLLGGQLGAVAILHTWDQQLNYHPHIHFIVPAGGMDNNGAWKTTKQNGDFLFNVEHLSSKFSAIFVKKLRKLKQEGKIKKYVPRDLIKSPWVIYAKQAFGTPKSVVEYLARYSHRVAISNARIIKVSNTHVTFRWCNREKGYKTETTTIRGVEFIERFLDHIIPAYFRRIRHLGFLSNRSKKRALETIRKFLNVKVPTTKRLTRAEVLALRFGERSLLKCKECGGTLYVLEVFLKKRAPPAWIQAC